MVVCGLMESGVSGIKLNILIKNILHTGGYPTSQKGVKMDINEINLIVTVAWKHEDELPDWIDDEVYKILYPSSRVDGVRLFPYVSICGKETFLITDFSKERQNG